MYLGGDRYSPRAHRPRHRGSRSRVRPFFRCASHGSRGRGLFHRMGPANRGFKRGGTEWRISAFPDRRLLQDEGRGFLSQGSGEQSRARCQAKMAAITESAPWRRMLISLAGPFGQCGLGLPRLLPLLDHRLFDSPTFPNRIVLLSEYDLGGPRLSEYPADKAGLTSGDRIVAADGKPIADFSDLLEKITLSADKPVHLKIDRDGTTYDKTVTPIMDKSTGGGFIGVSYWADPIVGTVASGSAAQIAGIEPGDRLVSIDGKNVQHAIAAFSILNSAKPERADIRDRKRRQDRRIRRRLELVDAGQVQPRHRIRDADSPSPRGLEPRRRRRGGSGGDMVDLPGDADRARKPLQGRESPQGHLGAHQVDLYGRTVRVGGHPGVGFRRFGDSAQYSWPCSPSACS